MKVVVLTTSYPRFEGDAAGVFVADAVEQLRERGVEVDVVSPASFRHFGIAYGSGVVGNLRRQPWKAALVPAMLGSFAQAARRAARDADLVHAHWLPSGAVALATGKPFVVQLWGTDVELARRMRGLARRVLSRARLTICASNALAEAARELGAGEVRVIPSDEFFPHMAQGIGVSDQVLKDKPDLVRKFVTAALRGMKDIMDDPNKAADDFVTYVPEWKGKEGVVKATLNYYATLVYPGQKQLGEIIVERLSNLQDFYLAKGIIQRKSPVEELYTNQFIK